MSTKTNTGRAPLTPKQLREIIDFHAADVELWVVATDGAGGWAAAVIVGESKRGYVHIEIERLDGTARHFELPGGYARKVIRRRAR